MSKLLTYIPITLYVKHFDKIEVHSTNSILDFGLSQLLFRYFGPGPIG